MAANVNGTGGVPPGSIYAVGRNNRVLRYTSTGEFKESWGGLQNPAGIAVDQATGNVYVFNTFNGEAGARSENLIEVFSATGSPIGEGFGTAVAIPPFPGLAESIEESPENMHEMGAATSSIAVDEAGKVYVTDEDHGNIVNPPGEARVMCFRPQNPGDYEHYVNCTAQDIRLGPRVNRFIRISLDNAGHLYGGGEESIKEYSLASPTSPICTYTVPGGGLQALTVNPATGEVFYFAKKKVHRLGPCDTETGHFKMVQEEPITVTPTTNEMLALTVNPALTWSSLHPPAARPPGVLYGADGENHFGLTPPLKGSGDIFAPAEQLSPSVESESVANTGTTSSTLRAEIDPRGFSTRFTFQYLSEAAFEANEPASRFAGAKEAPIGGGEIAGGSKGVAAAEISDLPPGTEFRFRVVASSECEGEGVGSEPCVTIGEAAAFRTFSAAASGPPDHRAYELVSPPQKNGGEVFPAEPGLGSCGSECKPPGGAFSFGGRFPMQSAPDGNGVVYEGFPFSASEGSAVFNEYLSKRTESGWQTIVLSPALQGKESPQGHLAFVAGLSEGLLYQGQGSPTLNPEAPSGYPNLYTQASGDPAALTPLLKSKPPNSSVETFKLSYAGHSADFSRQFFAANDALTKATPFAPEPPDPAPEKDLYEWEGGQLKLVNVLPGNGAVATGAAFSSASPDSHAISTNGSRVFWSSGGQLYVRENGEATVAINHGAEFLAASADGSRILFSDGCLYTLATEACEDLTQGQGGFQGIAGQSEDLSHIYFVDTAKLTGEEENDQGAKAQVGKDNLYVSEEGALHFIATLLPQDNVNGGKEEKPVDWASDPAERTAEASPNGNWLTFLSRAPLTGYNNVGPACELNSLEEFRSAPCGEVFLYDSATNQLRCASCNPTGEAPIGRSALRRIAEAEEWLPQPRYLTDSGRLYFDSSDTLSPLDTNHGVEDVYEFEPEGVGSCERASGCVSLISTGVGTNDANFLAMDETGANVFFTTRERLAPKDRDGLIDLYDAREFGGIAAEEEIAAGECRGEACQPAVTAPAESTPGSSHIEGPGNLTPTRGCKQGKVKKNGKCVKKTHHQRQKKHRRHKRRHARVDGNRGGAR